jgi:hypothetical protein
MNDEWGFAGRVAYAKGNPEALSGARSFMANVGRYETWARQAWRGIDVVRQHWDEDEPSSLDLSLVGATGTGRRSWLAALRTSFHHLLVGSELRADASEAAKAGRVGTVGARVVKRLRAHAEGLPDTVTPPMLPVGIEEGLPVIAALVEVLVASGTRIGDEQAHHVFEHLPVRLFVCGPHAPLVALIRAQRGRLPSEGAGLQLVGGRQLQRTAGGPSGGLGCQLSRREVRHLARPLGLLSGCHAAMVCQPRKPGKVDETGSTTGPQPGPNRQSGQGAER